ncbi:MAG: polyprenyl synthetase family protein, partial [Actinomycetota bacterium]|nr:polyprenyl synthetase family protein [Actinomycetota bacterium]
MPAGDGFDKRLCRTLVEDTLADMEVELAEIRAVRLLADYPFPAGKRLRPIVFLLSNFSVRVERSADFRTDGRESRFAAAIELLHEASLIHDDVVDHGDVRRGVESLQASRGRGLAVLIGDYMVFRAIKLLLEATTPPDLSIASDLADTALEVAHGEIDELQRYLRRHEEGPSLALDSYLEVISGKTAAFFAGAAEAGAALAGAPPAAREVYR